MVVVKLRFTTIPEMQILKMSFFLIKASVFVEDKLSEQYDLYVDIKFQIKN